ncbi:catabolic L-serine/threonine dehydratase [Coemansia sp. RSA 552]|nr:catabolic L-serine/threonine dehydratase [Coemansia sp. RSA 552]
MGVQERQQANSADREPQQLHSPTPLLYSAAMSRQAGCNVWLKLENMQPTQSSKIRGIGSLCRKAVAELGAEQLVAAGDTNTSLAVAYSGRRLGVPVSVFVPGGGQAPPIRPKIELEGAVVVEEGLTLRDAYRAAQAFASKTATAFLVDSSDDPAAVSGSATLASEINVQLQGREPAAIVTAVGSGALLAGIIVGLQQCRWQRVPVIAVETHNTNSFQQALLSDDPEVPSRQPPPSLLPPLEAEHGPDGDSAALHQSRPRTAAGDQRTKEPTVATCLLAGAPNQTALELSREHPVVPVSITEAMAVEACRRLLDEHQMLVEAGSAAALSVVGKGLIHQIIPGLDHESHVVVVVTGGANVSLDRLDSWRQRFACPAPIIAKSGNEVFMRMVDSAQPAASAASASPGHGRSGDTSAVSSQAA